jgi:hypothetical protein
MPADFYIDVTREMVFSKAIGVLGVTDCLDHMNRLQGHPQFRPEMNQIIDFCSVTEANLSHSELSFLARRTIFSARSRRAFVVASDLDFGLSRVFGTYRELQGEPGIRVFREMTQAMSWLDISVAADPRLFTRLDSSAGEA